MKFDKKFIQSQCTIIIAFAILFAIGIVFFTLKTMIIEREYWLDLKKNMFESDSLVVKPERGNILSCDGQVMASSLPDYKIYIDFLSGLSKEGMKEKKPMCKEDSLVWEKKDSLFHNNLDSICNGLSAIFPNKSPKEYKDYLQKGWDKHSRYYEICKGQVLNYNQKCELMKLPFFKEQEKHKYLVGLTIVERNKRKKPFGSLAQRTLGAMFAAKDSARFGLELAYDSILRGKPGIRHRRKVRNTYLDIIDVPAINGSDIVTTIDVNMQDICENALRPKLEELRALWGVVILMEVKTGDVKAIVNLQRDDNDGQYYETRNWALSAMIEPGSTFKTASIMVALDDGEIKYTDQIDTYSGVYKMHGSPMKDHNWSRGGYHVIDVPHTLMYSSNIGVSRLIDEHYGDKPMKFINGLRRVGISYPLGLPFAGSAKPYIISPEDKRMWSKTVIPWLSIGYNSQTPPISTVTFYNAIANGGKMMQPRFVKAVQRNGEITEEFPPVVLKEQICKPQTLKEIQTALYRVVNDPQGTGKRAGSKKFHISGKTGTAQVSQGKEGYTNGLRQYFVSFCGFYPSEDPKYTCVVGLRIPGPHASGGGMAGPVFSQIAERIYSNITQNNLSDAEDTISIKKPFVKAGDIHSAKRVLDALKIKNNSDEIDNHGWGTSETNDELIKLQVVKMENNIVPDLTGMGARDAIFAIESRGMKAKLEGVGKVVKQSIKPGTEITKGKTIEIQLKSLE